MIARKKIPAPASAGIFLSFGGGVRKFGRFKFSEVAHNLENRLRLLGFFRPCSKLRGDKRGGWENKFFQMLSSPVFLGRFGAHSFCSGAKKGRAKLRALPFIFAVCRFIADGIPADYFIVRITFLSDLELRPISPSVIVAFNAPTFTVCPIEQGLPFIVKRVSLPSWLFLFANSMRV